MTSAFIFPGQGSQAVGMGRSLADEFPVAREVFEEVDEALSQKLSTLMWEGPDEAVTLTENAQPALMAVSMAVVRTLERERGLDLAAQAGFVAGHSLGEYSALAAVGVFSLADAARLLKTRGRAMQRAVPAGEGAMAALLGLEFRDVEEIAGEAARDGVCQVANDNAPGQVVVSGGKAAVERAIELARERGARRAVPLPVSAPFHCALMQPAADVMADALSEVAMAAPAAPVMANATAGPTSDPEEIRNNLVGQMTGMVRWRECVEAMAADGVTCLYELGAGKVLGGLAKRIDRNLDVRAIGAPDDMAAFKA